MDKEVYNETLKTMPNDFDYKLISFTNDNMVYGKYLYVYPPFGGTPSMEQEKKNKFSMKYNELYNTKFNINPYESDTEESDTV